MVTGQFTTLVVAMALIGVEVGRREACCLCQVRVRYQMRGCLLALVRLRLTYSPLVGVQNQLMIGRRGLREGFPVAGSCLQQRRSSRGQVKKAVRGIFCSLFSPFYVKTT